MKREINFLGNSKIWVLISTVLILIGVASMFYNQKSKGKILNFGVDFTGGTSLIIRFDSVVQMGKDGLSEKERLDTISKIRSVFAKHGLADSVIQIITGNDVVVKVKVLENKERQDIFKSLTKKIGKAELLEVDTIGPTIGAELREKAFWILIVAVVGLLLYITWRFEFIYSLGAILALIHDTMIAIGFASLLYIKVDTAFVAAILTILGYSINDTIVVFDRIRENNHLMRRKMNLFNIANMSINQTLSRSINTSLTTLLAITSVYIFGGITTKDFALTLIIGVIVGTYSSIFIASPVIVWMRGKA